MGRLGRVFRRRNVRQHLRSMPKLLKEDHTLDMGREDEPKETLVDRRMFDTTDTNSGGISAGSYNDNDDPRNEKREKIAKDLYTQTSRRKRDFEIDTVSRNSGFSVEEVDRIFAHIYERDHLFEDGTVHKFDPDYYMAHS